MASSPEQAQYTIGLRNIRTISPIERSSHQKAVSLIEEDYKPLHVDSIKQYLRDINRVPLLTRAQESQLCQVIEKGRLAKEILRVVQELGIPQVVTPNNNLPPIERKAAGILQEHALQYLEEFGLEKDDVTLVLKKRAVKKNIFDSGDPSKTQEKDVGSIESDEQFATLPTQQQSPEATQEVMIVEDIDVRHLENITIALHTQTLYNAIKDGERARQDFIKANLRLVVSVAKRYTYAYINELLDLIQDGNIGLSKAVSKFEWWKGNKFSTYSFNWIRQTVDRGKKDKNRTIRIPVHAQEIMDAIERTRRNLFDTNGYEPTLEEIANTLGWDLEKVEETIELAQNAREPISIDQQQIVNGDIQDNTLAATIPSIEPGPHDEAEINDFREKVRSILSGLSEREAKVLTLRLGLDDGGERTLDQVGTLFGVTRERIRQIQEKALNKLRNPDTKRLLTINE